MVFLNSCVIVTTGITNDYGKLDESQKAKITPLENFAQVRPGMIYLINASQLKDEISKYPKSIVYIFTNGCSSEHCKPMSVYENYAEKNGYKLFLVTTGFGNLDETTDQKFKGPLFSIDNKYYNCNFRSKYCRYFENELLDKPIQTKRTEYLGSIYFFKNGKFEKILNDLP